MLKRFVLGLSIVLTAGAPALLAQVAPSSPLQSSSRGSGQAAGGRTGASAGQSATGPVPITTDITKVKLLPGARIDVHTFEEPDLDGSYRLDAQGNISIPLVGLVQVQGLTPGQAEGAISAALIQTQILKEAHVTVALAEYGTNFVTVLGEVNAPGKFPATGPQTLADILATAGGETAIAGNEITIKHANHPPESQEIIHYKRATLDSAAMDVEVDPGDTVLVKRAGIVYVLGAVNRPGGYVMQDEGELNVDQALALALGTSLTGKIGSVRVLRKQSDGTILELPVNYTKINKGQEVSLQLAANDIVYVPQSSIKNVALHATSVFTAAVSSTIYSLY